MNATLATTLVVVWPTVTVFISSQRLKCRTQTAGCLRAIRDDCGQLFAATSCFLISRSAEQTIAANDDGSLTLSRDLVLALLMIVVGKGQVGGIRRLHRRHR